MLKHTMYVKMIPLSNTTVFDIDNNKKRVLSNKFSWVHKDRVTLKTAEYSALPSQEYI